MNRALLLSAVLCLTAARPAAAGPPTVDSADPPAPVMTVLGDKETVQGQVRVSGDLEQVRALVRDPHATAAAAGDGDLTIEDVGRDGACRLVRWTVPHPIMTVTYVGRMCPTDAGVHITLVESDDMAEYESTWEVVPTDSGQLDLRCRVRSRPSFPLPRAVVRTQIKKELGASLARIQASLAGASER